MIPTSKAEGRFGKQDFHYVADERACSNSSPLCSE